MQGSWSADQTKYIEWLATPRYTRTPPTAEMLAAEIGVDYSTLWRWKQLPGFQDEVNGLARAGLRQKLPEAYGALAREAEAGSYQHLQLLFEMTGEYVKQQRNMNEQSGEMTLRIIEVDADGQDD